MAEDVPSSHDLALSAKQSEIFYCLPHNGEWIPEGMPSAVMPSMSIPVNPKLNRSSFLNHSFNMYWCMALNQTPRPIFWAMHHADMAAEPGWLDTLLEVMREKDADVVSCVACIKDTSGDTNAAAINPAGGLRRLTLAECAALPPVFSSDDLPNGERLLVNTGLWVVRFDRPWVEKFPGFSFTNRIARSDEGKFVAMCMSEDWKFSLWAHEMGLRVFATTLVKTYHFGQKAWEVGGPRG